MSTNRNEHEPEGGSPGNWLPTVQVAPRDADTQPLTVSRSSSMSSTEAATGERIGEVEQARTEEAGSSSKANEDQGASPAKGLAQYIDLQPVGRWKYGQLFDARHKVLGRKVRLRLIDPETSTNPSLRAEYLGLARALALFRHPQVDSGIFEAVDEGRELYLAAEPARGEPLKGLGLGLEARSRARTWLYPNARLGRCLLEAATGLGAIHEAGLFHGHIRPEHLRYDRLADTVRLGGLGEPPEQAEERPVSREDLARRDLRDLASSFAEIVTGHPISARLLSRGDSRAITRAIRFRNPWVSSEIADLLGRAMASPKDARAITSAEEFATEVGKHLGHQTYLAGWGDRYGTLFYDAVILIFATAAFLLLISALENLLRVRLPEWPWSRSEKCISLITGYFAALEIIARTTPGRLIRGLRLIDPSGGHAGRVRIAARFALQLVLWWLFATGMHHVGKAIQAGRFENFADRPSPAFLSAFMGQGLPELFVNVLAGYVVLQITAFCHPRRRPIHDALTHATWGVREEVDPPRLTVTPAPIESSTISRPEDYLMRLDHFLLIREVGRGGMGTVYEAWDDVLHRRVAIKRITPALEAGGTTLRRFEQEAYLAAQIDHPNVARLYAVGWSAGRPYLVMEYIDGEDLQNRVGRLGPMSVSQAWELIVQAARGLREAHRLGIVHRDIKPSNLMLARDGSVKVMDFGISKLVTGNDREWQGEPESARDASEPSAAELEAAETNLTHTGALLGTPRFMSPEQALGRPVDVRSDIYSLGLTLFYLLAGYPPFESRELREMIRLQCNSPLPALPRRSSRLTRDQRDLLERMTAKDGRNRPADYDELLKELAECAPRRPRLATLLPRVWAFLLDSLVVSLPAALYVGMEFQGVPAARVVAFSLLVLGGLAWGLAKHGSSLGKWMLGLEVVRRDGGRVGWGRALLRLGFTAPVLYAGLLAGYRFRGTAQLVADGVSSLLLVSALLIAFTQPRRAIHDYVAGTVVVQHDSKRRRRPRIGASSEVGGTQVANGGGGVVGESDSSRPTV